MTAPYSSFDHNQPSQPGVVPMQPVGYGRDFNQATTVHIQHPEYEVEYKFSWTHFIMSIVTLIFGTFCCCNPVSPVFSLLGLVYSANSYSSHGDKAWERSRRQNTAAKIFSIIGLVFLLVYAVIGIIVLIVVFSSAASSPRDYYSGK